MKGIKKEICNRWYLRWMLVVSNWTFQSMLHLDLTEKVYKTSFTIFFTITIFFFLRIPFICAFLIGHTINWLVNNNFYAIFIHRMMISKLSKGALFEYSQSLSERLTYADWVLYAASFGSICRGGLKDSSDLDISIVRKTGIINGIKGLWFVLKEKKIADYNKIPLELYLNDRPESSIKKFGAEKNPVIIYDKNNIVRKYYSQQLSLTEARKLNGLDI